MKDYLPEVCSFLCSKYTGTESCRVGRLESHTLLLRLAQMCLFDHREEGAQLIAVEKLPCIQSKFQCNHFLSFRLLAYLS